MIVKNNILKQTPIAEGGEGFIYKIDKNNIVKVYKDNVDKKEKLQKIKKLMSKNLPNNIIKPIDIAYNSSKKFIGYTMKNIDGEEFKKLGNKKYIKINKVTIKDITRMLVKIKDTLQILHQQNIFISDLNDTNILFDKNYNLYFIDIDSWSVDNIKCTVAMDTFKDPLLVKNNFSAITDYYAFAILIFKSLTRLHPFGGVMNPDINILERMKKGISVIDNTKVKVPRNINQWNFISPHLIKELKDIFENNKRILVDLSLDEFYNNLEQCKQHNDYYYSKYDKCPICNDKVKVILAPIKTDDGIGIPYVLFFGNKNVNTILDLNTYLTNEGYIINNKSGNKVKFDSNYRYHYSINGDILYKISNDKVYVNNYQFEKINNTLTIVKDNKIYYTDQSSNLIELTIAVKGNYINKISKVAFNNIFDVYDLNNYFICNIYDNMKVINISGYNYVLKDNDKIINYGIHYDIISKQWLFIIENDRGQFKTYIFNKNEIKYETDKIKYSTELNNMCFNNGTIFIPIDGAIRGYSYSKNKYKDFICDIVTEDSKLIKESKKFTVINEKEIYKIG